MALGLVKNGCKVYIASRKESVLKTTCKELNEIGPGTCEYIVADLVSKAACYALYEEVKKKESKVHILINNTGVTWGGTMEDFPEENGWNKVMSLNVKAPYYLTVAFLPLLEAAAVRAVDPARVIMISSVGGFDPKAGQEMHPAGIWSYGASKAALNHLTRIMAVTLAKRSITVNAVAPATFPSGMTAYQLVGAKNPEIAPNQPMGRIGKVEDMAAVALFLSSKASAHITGIIIPLSGGQELGMLRAPKPFEPTASL
ncbi:hypothetical protein SmJEL517_g02124 [Synchytrium microbalum]|uniref:3-oxoacyl-[acyl-carrier-protein] reductase n=1 Tax=Synchytrium microbalum TaxID=1806994 RepID=A0A507C7Z0_9FUNG|nr:uncharacterized protein SmJEL517_g02124 [Synchytrium microbalum]TPX35438.1 hypothetical protein SmJEL517_g02124 [Synchytrium microbalum]